MYRLLDAHADAGTGIIMTLCFGSQVIDTGRLMFALQIGSRRFENSHINKHM